MELKTQLNRYFEEIKPKRENRKKAKDVLCIIVQYIVEGVKQLSLKETFGLEFERVEYVGSEWDGTKIGNSDFDVILCFTLDGRYFKIKKVRSYHSFDNIRYRIIPTQHCKDFYGEKIIQNFCDFNSMQLNPTKIVEAIRHKASAALDAHRSPTGTIRVRVEDINTTGCHFEIKMSTPDVKKFKSDFTVAFDVKKEDNIRQMIRLGTDKYGNTNLWQESFSFEEKKLLKGIDSMDNGCRKKIYKILKSLKNDKGRNSPLHGISTYVFKNAIFFLRNLNWNESKMEERFKNILQFLECAFEEDYMERYFEKGSGGNLLCRCDFEDIKNSARLLKNIRINTKDYSILLR